MCIIMPAFIFYVCREVFVTVQSGEDTIVLFRALGGQHCYRSCIASFNILFSSVSYLRLLLLLEAVKMSVILRILSSVFHYLKCLPSF